MPGLVAAVSQAQQQRTSLQGRGRPDSTAAAAMRHSGHAGQARGRRTVCAESPEPAATCAAAAPEPAEPAGVSGAAGRALRCLDGPAAAWPFACPVEAASLPSSCWRIASSLTSSSAAPSQRVSGRAQSLSMLWAGSNLPRQPPQHAAACTICAPPTSRWLQQKGLSTPDGSGPELCCMPAGCTVTALTGHAQQVTCHWARNAPGAGRGPNKLHACCCHHSGAPFSASTVPRRAASS